MFFRNLIAFHLPKVPLLDFEFIAALRPCALKPVGAMELTSIGFVPPYGQRDGALVEVQELGRVLFFSVGAESKVMPPGAVAKAVADRMAKAEERLGIRISGRQRKAFKEEAIAEMLPRAFVEPRRTNALIDTTSGLLWIDTSSRKVAEAVVGELRRALGSFAALPWAPQVPVRGALTNLLLVAGATEAVGAAGRVTLGDRAVLADPADHGAEVSVKRSDLTSEEIATHLEAGKQVARLEVTFDDHLTLQLCDDLSLRGVKFLDGALATLEDKEFDSTRQELDARVALMAGEFRRLYPALKALFQLGDLPCPSK